MEQEHPIPQQISTYEFRLVGDMTLKQFFQVAAGALIALLIYSSGLAGYIKWPLIIISFLSGVAFAFFPLQDRPLATWLVLFFKAIYSPTVYVWKKGAGLKQYFKPEPTAGPSQPTPAGKKAPKEAEEKGPEKDFPELERKEKEFLSQVQKQIVKPGPGPQGKIKEPEDEEQEEKQREVEVPEDEKVKVQREKKAKPSPQQPPPSEVGGEIAPSAGSTLSDAKMAQFSNEAAPPTPPSKANVVVGQVMDSEGKIVEGAILEIKDEDGRSVRALKTNKAGHFMIVTPLSNGKYQLTTEKQGLEFESLNFEAKGEIIQPIAIKAEGKRQE